MSICCYGYHREEYLSNDAKLGLTLFMNTRRLLLLTMKRCTLKLGDENGGDMNFNKGGST